jgi:chaperonin GroEL
VALARATLIVAQLRGDNDDQRFGIDIVRKAILQDQQRRLLSLSGRRCR